MLQQATDKISTGDGKISTGDGYLNKRWVKSQQVYNKRWAKILTSYAKISVQQISHQVVKILTTCHLNVFSPTFISISTGLAWIFNLDEIL